MEDSRIVELFWQRSEDAIGVAEEKYGSLCRMIARNLLRNEEDVQECVNDTWHSLWNAIPPERPDKLTPFIARITRNLAMKRLRHQNAAKRRAVTVSFEELDQCISDQRTAETVLEQKELARAMDAFLDTLEAVDRNLFLRRYWFFDSVRQLSRSFGISETNVKVKLHRIRKELKKYLEQEAQIYVG